MKTEMSFILFAAIVACGVFIRPETASAAPRNDFRSTAATAKNSVARFLRIEGRAAIVRQRITKKFPVQCSCDKQ